MENLSKKVPYRSGHYGGAKSVYDDVFAAPPRFGVPSLSPRIEDYAEIFGGLRGSRVATSIPMLDLPPADVAEVEVSFRGLHFDYLEVFGGSEGSDFVVYEELVERSKHGIYDSSDEAWTPAQSETLSDESEPFACSDSYQTNAEFHSSSNGTTQFKVSYNKVFHTSEDDVANGVSRVTQLNEAPGYSFLVNEVRPPQKMVVTNNLKHEDFSGELREGKQFKKSTSLPNKPFVTVSDISLKTRPSHLPPPSRPPPSLGSKDGDSDTQSLKMKASRSFAFGETTSDDDSPLFYDVEVDASSSAAVSAAEMKDVMEKAQAKLKSAKNLKQRNRQAKVRGEPSERDFCGGKGLTENSRIHGKELEKSSFKNDGNVEWKEDEKFYEVVETEDSRNLFDVRDDQRFVEHNLQNNELRREKRESQAIPLEEVGDSKMKSNSEIHEKIIVEAVKSEDFENMAKVWERETDDEKRYENDFEIEENGMRLRGDAERERYDKRLKEAIERAKIEKQLKETLEREEKEKIEREAREREEKEKREIEARERELEEKRLRDAIEKEEKEKKMRSALEEKEKKQREAWEKEEKEKREKEAHEKELEENRLREATEKEEKEQSLRLALEEEKKQREFWEREEKEKKEKEARERELDEKRLREAIAKEEKENRLRLALQLKEKKEREAREREEKEKREKEARERELEEKRLREAIEKEENEKRLRLAPEEKEKKQRDAREREEKEAKEKEAREREAEEKRLEKILEEKEKKQKEAREKEEKEKREKEKKEKEDRERELEKKRIREALEQEEKENKLKIALEKEKNEKRLKLARERDEAEKRLKENLGWDNISEPNVTLQRGEHEGKDCEPKENTQHVQQVHEREDNKNRSKEAFDFDHEDIDKMWEDNIGLDENVAFYEAANKEQNLSSSGAARDGLQYKKREATVSKSKDSLPMHDTVFEFEKVPSKKKANFAKPNVVDYDLGEKGANMEKFQVAKDKKEEKFTSSQEVKAKVQTQNTERKGENLDNVLSREEKEREERMSKERKMENERLRKIEEEREREREREKDRMAVNMASLEKAAVERATVDTRQRALAEARERLEKANAEARQKAERAAVERATAEVRERAFQKAKAEKAAFETRERAERMRQSSLQSDSFQCAGSITNGSMHAYSSVHGGVEVESAQRCKARLERHQRTAQRAAKALEEKNQRDLLAQRELSERNRLAEGLDAEVKRWSSGKEGNLRALLATLQYILGPDSGWQPIHLTEVITSAAVKRAYRKATLCVHPDKLQQRGASIHQKYICEKVFDLLKAAWNKFNSEER